MSFLRKIKDFVTKHVLLTVALASVFVMGVLMLNILIINLRPAPADAGRSRTNEWIMTGKRVTSTKGNGSFAYEYDNAGNCTKCTEYDEYGNVVCTEEWQYDAKGNAVKYSLDNRLNQEQNLNEAYKYEYDANGFMVSMLYTRGYDYWNPMLEYKYDKYGNCVRKIDHTVAGKSDVHYYKYDKSNNLVREMIFWGSDCYGGGVMYELDGNGNTVRGYYINRDEYTEDEDGNIEYLTKQKAFDSKFNSAKNILVVTHYSAEGLVCGRTEYDTAGNKLKYSVIECDGTVSLWTEYKYDGYGNLLKATSFLNGGKVMNSEEYEYMYMGLN